MSGASPSRVRRDQQRAAPVAVDLRLRRARTARTGSSGRTRARPSRRRPHRAPRPRGAAAPATSPASRPRTPPRRSRTERSRGFDEATSNRLFPLRQLDKPVKNAMVVQMRLEPGRAQELRLPASACASTSPTRSIRVTARTRPTSSPATRISRRGRVMPARWLRTTCRAWWARRNAARTRPRPCSNARAGCARRCTGASPRSPGTRRAARRPAGARVGLRRGDGPCAPGLRGWRLRVRPRTLELGRPGR